MNIKIISMKDISFVIAMVGSFYSLYHDGFSVRWPFLNQMPTTVSSKLCEFELNEFSSGLETGSDSLISMRLERIHE